MIKFFREKKAHLAQGKDGFIMKKATALLLTVVMALSLAACGSSTSSTTSANTTAAANTAAATTTNTTAAANTTAANTTANTAANTTASTTAGTTTITKAFAGKTLTMATNAQFPPYEYYDGDKVVGIDADLAQAIADELGMTLKIEDMDFDTIINAVQSGKADIGVAGMTVTEERLKNISFTDSYITSSQMILIKSDNTEITGPDSLEGKKIGVQLGTTGDIYAQDIKDAKIEEYNSGFEAVQALSQGKLDAVIIDEEPAKVFVEKTSGAVKLVDEPFTNEDYAICVAKDNTELLDAVNAVLADLKQTGKLQQIIDKYISAK